MMAVRIAVQAVFFVGLLLVISFHDIKTRTIPDCFNGLVALTMLVCFNPFHIFGLLTALPFLIAAICTGGMGGGDIKLMAACGMVLGFSYGMLAEVIGLFLLLCYYAVYYLVRTIRKKGIEKSFPLAPFLSAGCIAAYMLRLQSYGFI